MFLTLFLCQSRVSKRCIPVNSSIIMCSHPIIVITCYHSNLFPCYFHYHIRQIAYMPMFTFYSCNAPTENKVDLILSYVNRLNFHRTLRAITLYLRRNWVRSGRWVVYWPLYFCLGLITETSRAVWTENGYASSTHGSVQW